MRTHDKNRERTFVCPEENCGKSFYDQQHLKQHLVTHQRGQHVHVEMMIFISIDICLSLSELYKEVYNTRRIEFTY